MREVVEVVGPGRAGLSVGDALWQSGALRHLVFSGRTPDPPSHPLFTQGVAEYRFGLERPGPLTHALILAVPDDALQEVSEAVAARGEAPPGCAAFHLSGTLSTEAMAALHVRGYALGSMHPLQTLGDAVSGAERLVGATWAVSGQPAALKTAGRLLDALDARTVTIPVGHRATYHAAAVMASNDLVTLLRAAARLLADSGFPRGDALSALLDLTRSALDDLERLGAREAVTGPVTRGDAETVGLHLRALDRRHQRLYAALGGELLEQAVEEGMDPVRAAAVFEVLEKHR